MSSCIYCPDCDVLVTETGWGDEAGEYECRECGCEFEAFWNDAGGIGMRVV